MTFALLAAQSSPVTTVSVDVAVVATVVALASGWYGARWWQAERDEDAVRARLDGTLRILRRARRAAIVMLLIVVAAVDMWFRGKGR
jgi:hypothetical protein